MLDVGLRILLTYVPQLLYLKKSVRGQSMSALVTEIFLHNRDTQVSFTR